MTVEEMLDRISAKEVSEWMAYEKATGPLGHQYSDDLLAHIHEQLQNLSYITGAQYEDNPAGLPKRIPRPYQIHEEPVGEMVMDAEDLADYVPEEGS